MTTVAIVQARMGSTRLPGKALVDIAGEPMLGRVIDRLQRATTLDGVVVATTTLDRDNPIVDYCSTRGAAVHRGPEADVLTRYLQAAEAEAADVIVRITSDCPLIDPQVVDAVVGARGDADYASNTLEPRTFPRGLDCEAMTRTALERADRLDTDPGTREHVTAYIARHPDSFDQRAVRHREDFSRFRWTVDTQADLELVRTIHAHDLASLPWLEIAEACLAHRDWMRLNADVRQKDVP